MYCANCGTQLAEGSSFCPNCGAKKEQQTSAQNPPKQQAPMQQVPVGRAPLTGKKKKKGLGCLVVVLIFIGLITALSQLSDGPTQGKIENSAEQPKTAEELLADGLEFDERSWNNFLKLYTAHDDFMKMVGLYSDGRVSELDFYDYCKDIEEWFGKASISFNYAKSEDEKKYLSTFEDFALADQLAAKSLIKYLDSNANKDLSKAREEIEIAKQAATIIASNRVIYLKSIGLSTEKVEEMVDKAVSDIEKIENEDA